MLRETDTTAMLNNTCEARSKSIDTRHITGHRHRVLASRRGRPPGVVVCMYVMKKYSANPENDPTGVDIENNQLPTVGTWV